MFLGMVLSRVYHGKQEKCLISLVFQVLPHKFTIAVSIPNSDERVKIQIASSSSNRMHSSGHVIYSYKQIRAKSKMNTVQSKTRFDGAWYTLSNDCSEDKYIYFHKANTIVFTIISAIKQARAHLSSKITGRISFFGYVIYSPADANCQQCMSAEE